MFTVEEAIKIAMNACVKAHAELSVEDLNNTKNFKREMQFYVAAAFKNAAKQPK